MAVFADAATTGAVPLLIYLLLSLSISATVGSTGAALGRDLAGEPSVVMTDYGPVQGSMEGAVEVFHGIPFAAPPIEGLRWRPPRSHKKWTTVRPAVKLAPECGCNRPLCITRDSPAPPSTSTLPP